MRISECRIKRPPTGLLFVLMLLACGVLGGSLAGCGDAGTGSTMAASTSANVSGTADTGQISEGTEPKFPWSNHVTVYFDIDSVEYSVESDTVREPQKVEAGPVGFHLWNVEPDLGDSDMFRNLANTRGLYLYIVKAANVDELPVGLLFDELTLESYPIIDTEQLGPGQLVGEYLLGPTDSIEVVHDLDDGAYLLVCPNEELTAERCLTLEVAGP